MLLQKARYISIISTSETNLLTLGYCFKKPSYRKSNREDNEEKKNTQQNYKNVQPNFNFSKDTTLQSRIYHHRCCFIFSIIQPNDMNEKNKHKNFTEIIIHSL